MQYPIHFPLVFGGQQNGETQMLTGLGMFIWMLKDTEGGDMQKAAQVAVDAGITHVLIKIADGKLKYNMRPLSGGGYADDILEPAVAAFKARGIQVWGWQYIYLVAPTAEGQLAKQRTQALGLDGFVFDVEGECKNQPVKTAEYLAAVKGIGVPTAFSSYRWPTLHPELDYRAWINASDIMMPQVYWMLAKNSAYQLERSYNEYQALLKKYGYTFAQKPYFPTGAAFSEWGWTAQPAEIKAYLDKAVALGLAGTNFWVWSHARRLAEGQWNVIADYPWPGTPPPPPPPPGDTLPVDDFVRDQVYPFMVKAGYSGPKPE